MNVFIVMQNLDTTEGRGPMILDAIFSTEKEALDYVSKRFGIMGRKTELKAMRKAFLSDYQVQGWELNDHDIFETRVFESAEAMEICRKETLRIRALDKLSDEEKEALGLKK